MKVSLFTAKNQVLVVCDNNNNDKPTLSRDRVITNTFHRSPGRNNGSIVDQAWQHWCDVERNRPSIS